MKQMFRLVSLIESCKFSTVRSLNFAILFIRIAYPNLKIQEYSIVIQKNDSLTRQNKTIKLPALNLQRKHHKKLNP